MLSHSSESSAHAVFAAVMVVTRFTKSSAFSATSRQPASMVSECPRPGILTISVTLLLCFCFLYAAFAIAQGTVWSESAETISIGPRFGFVESTFASDHGLKFADAAWKRGSPGPGTEELLRLVLADRVREAVAELLVGERDRAVPGWQGCAGRHWPCAAPRSAAAARRR